VTPSDNHFPLEIKTFCVVFIIFVVDIVVVVVVVDLHVTVNYEGILISP